MRRALVTGGTGFIGRHLIRALRSRKYDVQATSRSNVSAEALEQLGAVARVWDLSSSDSADGLMEGVDVVFHLACPRRIFNQSTGSSHRPGSEILVQGTSNLANAFANSHAKRFILASSVAVYGKIWGKVDEETPTNPAGIYGQARLATEAICRKILSEDPERLVIARLTEVFGSGNTAHNDLLAHVARGDFRIIGDGSAHHHVSTVDDIVSGFVACAEIQEVGGALMNLGGQPRTFRDFILAACDAARQPLRETPLLQLPAILALRAMTKVSSLRDLFPHQFAQLDYQLRPKAFEIAKSRSLLGDYAKTDFEKTMNDCFGGSGELA